jgi:hypothetical protein
MPATLFLDTLMMVRQDACSLKQPVLFEDIDKKTGVICGNQC